jgi:hypothetical protein
VNNLRRWQIDPNQAFVLPLAADARLSQTDYADDQVWDLSLGEIDSPALALQTRYGGRAGLVSLVPMWLHEGRSIYQYQAYAIPPIITGFAPGYLRVQASLTHQLALQAEYWAMESHAIGARFTLSNAHTTPTQIRLDVLGHVGIGGQERKLAVMPLTSGGHALSLGRIGNLNPALVLEGGSGDSEGYISPKIGREFTVEGRKKMVVKWVCAGLPDAAASIALAQRWLQADWESAFQQINLAAEAIPIIETGDPGFDLLLANSWQQLVLSVLKPTASLPHASLVATRASDHGFSPRGDGSDHDRTWNGQDPTFIYPAALALASVNPQIAQGIVRNYLALQRQDGWLDHKPGLGGQRENILCMPVLARLSWGIFQYSEDSQFLRDVFPGLIRFFERWLQEDTDHDGLPEWTNERQSGTVFLPTFAAGQAWGQNADIRLVEPPGLLAFLLSEAASLREIAYYLHDSAAEAKLKGQIDALKTALESLWRDDRYVYRDRDSHITTNSVVILAEGRGDEEHLPVIAVNPPNRLIVRVTGGVDHAPKLKLYIQGLNAEGETIEETAEIQDFLWQNRRGVYTSRQIYAQVDRIRCDGLSRVYSIHAQTLDTTRLDINALLPLWSVSLPPERAERLVLWMTDSDHFWREGGVTLCSVQDPDFNPANLDGCGGVWPFWLTLLGEGLIESGHIQTAFDLFQRFTRTQMSVFQNEKQFFEFYHSDEAKGLGTPGHLNGVLPLHLLMRLIGVRVISEHKVWVGGQFLWDSPVSLQQHGVRIKRSREETIITFPSGYETKISGERWQEITDSGQIK